MKQTAVRGQGVVGNSARPLSRSLRHNINNAGGVLLSTRGTASAADSGNLDPMRWKKNFKRVVPQGDSRERMVCQECGFINYVNPKIVAGVVALSSTYPGALLRSTDLFADIDPERLC